MKPVPALLSAALLALSVAAAQAQAPNLTLEGALAKASEQAPVASARTELADAQANLQRVLSDPLLTRPARVQAEQRAALAQANLDRSVAQAQNSIAGAYAQVLEANIQNRLAQKGLEIATRGVEVAQIRQRNGSGTALDLRNAQNRQDDARSNATRAANGLTLAQNSLRSLVGAFGNLAPLPAAPAVPDDNAVKALMDKSPDIIQARQRVALATMQVELLDPAYAAQADIDAAKARAEQAGAGAREIERGFSLNYDSLQQNAAAAFRSLSIQQQALANAREALENDRRRLSSGLISALTFQQSELTFIQAELAAQQAQGNYFRAFYSLQAGGR
ncbi:MAG: TolC family protein [Meiothermus sp.]|nr:TolC family protein [Meiothermus sp.]